MNKKKIIGFSVSAALIVILIVVGIVFLVGMSAPLKAPTEVEIIESNDKVYVQTEANLNAKAYVFKIKSSKFIHEVNSNSNICDITSYVTEPLLYTFSAKYKGNAAGADSQYSNPYSWQKTITLNPTQLELDQENKLLKWNSVSGANYYELNLKAEGNALSKVRVAATDAPYIEFPLSKLDGGVYTFSVVACSNISTVKKSRLSNTIEYEYFAKYNDLVIVSFYPDRVVCTSSNNLQKINVYFGETKYTFDVDSQLVTKTEIDGGYSYALDISLCYQSNARLGVQAEGDGAYNETGEITYYVE